MENYRAIRDEAVRIAESASQIALSHFRQALLIEMKENHTPVTMADKKTEEYIRKELSTSFPRHAVLGEEFGKEGDSEFLWTIDPIDGTRSFIRGLPLFGTLLGLLYRNEPVVGVIAMPILDEVYYASKGEGAYCDGHSIHVSATQSMQSSFFGLGDLVAFESTGTTHVLQNISEQSEIARNYTDCFGHAMVTRGALDAMVDPSVSPWDVAPVACIVKEAGGVYFTFDGEETVFGKNFITCTPVLKDPILNIVNCKP